MLMMGARRRRKRKKRKAGLDVDWLSMVVV
jgi:hypothetical protein